MTARWLPSSCRKTGADAWAHGVRRSNETKHRERFAVRAKYMTLEPTANKYVKYIRNIRTIQVR